MINGSTARELGGPILGSLNGELPGFPVNVKVEPSTVTIVTPPGSRGDWRFLVLVNTGPKTAEIRIRWSAK